MDYEKNNEAIDIVKRMVADGQVSQEVAEKYFHELAESEDERVRKKVIDVLKLNVRGAESQMQASRGVDRTFEVYACNKVIAWLEKQGEQNTNNSIWHKVEPKEYVLEKTLICKENGEIDLVEDTILSVTGAKYALPISFLGIPKSLEKQGEQKPYGRRQECVDCQFNYAGECKGSCAMKRDEQKPAEWSEEDETIIDNLVWAIANDRIRPQDRDDYCDWLKDLKDRAQPQPKQEWSEEDKRSIRDSIFYLKSAKKYFEKDDDILWDEKWFNLCIEFLEALYKKLQPQTTWKPSDEQMKVLDVAIKSSHLTTAEYNGLVKLREQLKSL